MDYFLEMPNYRNPALTVDALVSTLNPLTKQLKVLMIQRGRDPFKGFYAFPGGFVDYGEDPKIAVLRELEEETHLKGFEPELVSVRGDPSRDPRQHIVTIAYAVKIANVDGLKADDDAHDYKWFDIEDLVKRNVPLAFDHQSLLEEYHKWLFQDVSSGLSRKYPFELRE